MSQDSFERGKPVDLTAAYDGVFFKAIYLGDDEVGFDGEARVEFAGESMTIRLKRSDTGGTLTLQGSEFSSGYRALQPSGAQASAAWALLGDVWVGRWRRREGEYLFYFRLPENRPFLVPRTPDFSEALAYELHQEIAADLWLCADAIGGPSADYVEKLRASFIRRPEKMVFEVPAQSDFPLYEITGELQKVGYFAGRTEMITSAGVIARWAPLPGGFVGTWREGGLELFFLLRRQVPHGEPIEKHSTQRDQRPEPDPPARKPPPKSAGRRSPEKATMALLYPDREWQTLWVQLSFEPHGFQLVIPKQPGSTAYDCRLERDGETYRGRGTRSDGLEVLVTTHHSAERISGLWVEAGVGYPFIIEFSGKSGSSR